MSFIHTPARARQGVVRVFYGEQELRAGWRLAIFILLFVVALLAGNQIVAIAFGPLAPVGAAVARKVVNVAGLLVAMRVMARLEHRSIARYGLPWRQLFRSRFWIGMATGVVALSLVVGVLALLGAAHVRGLALHGADTLRWGGAYLAIFTVVAVDEELRFRGYTLFTLASGVGFWPAAGGLSLLFGIGHLGNPGESWFGVVNVVLGGLVLAAMVWRTGDLWLAIGVHAGWDWAQTFVFGVANSGNDLPGHLLETATTGPSWLAGGSVGPEGGLVCTAVWIAMGCLAIYAYRGTGHAVHG